MGDGVLGELPWSSCIKSAPPRRRGQGCRVRFREGGGADKAIDPRGRARCAQNPEDKGAWENTHRMKVSRA